MINVDRRWYVVKVKWRNTEIVVDRAIVVDDVVGLINVDRRWLVVEKILHHTLVDSTQVAFPQSFCIQLELANLNDSRHVNSLLELFIIVQQMEDRISRDALHEAGVGFDGLAHDDGGGRW